MRDIKLLLPKVQRMTEQLITECKAQGISLIITATYRSEKEQSLLYAQGRTMKGGVVTNAKAGESMHNYKVAVDFVPAKDGVPLWGDKALFLKVGEIGEKIGFEWGGRWKSFLDLPHLQYTAGYTLKQFQNKVVDYTKFS